MVKNRYQNRNFGPSEGAKIQNFQRTVSLDPNGRLHKFKGHNSSNNLLKDEQNLKKRNVKKEDQILSSDQLWYKVVLVNT